MAPEAAGMAPEVRQGTTLPAHVAAVAATHLHDLIVTALDAGRQPSELALGRGVRAAKLATVKAEIRARAACSDLSIDGVAKRCGISPQYVRKLFRAEGTTFTDFVRNERLKRAWRRLTDPRCSRWSITAVALECGFADLSYFNRLFRRRYGMTPSDAKVLGHALSGSTGSAANLPRLSAFCPTSRRVLSKII